VLTAFALCLGLLVLLAAAAVPLGRPARAGVLVHGGCLAACCGFMAVALFALLTAPSGATLELPFGPPWGAVRLGIDGLSAWFLLLLGLTGACASLFALGHPPGPARTLPPFPLFIAGMALTLAATDAFVLLLGFELMSFASWALVAAEHEKAENREAARLYLGFAVLAAGCLVPAFGLLAGGAGSLDFAAMRAAPPEGWRAAAVLALGLAGAGAKAGLVPLHLWLPLAHPAAPSHVSALMSGAMTKIAVYVLARLLLDLCGPAQPFWWGVPLLVVGAASALLGALRANLEGDVKTLLACSTIENIGLITLGLGLALAFRGADLGGLAALAAGAALLHALNHGIFKTLLFLVAGAVLHSAGSRQLDRLGGLIHAMPVTAGAALVGAAAAASLPPLSGFAGEWLLLQSVLAGWKVGDIGFQVLAAAAVALAAMAAALAAAAMLRFYGLVFLGRPRSPRLRRRGDGDGRGRGPGYARDGHGERVRDLTAVRRLRRGAHHRQRDDVDHRRHLGEQRLLVLARQAQPGVLVRRQVQHARGRWGVEVCTDRIGSDKMAVNSPSKGWPTHPRIPRRHRASSRWGRRRFCSS
jgi:formate hydrogenlyase subunit 3/multisubunit Na+/H+ antiporter MnhD subunit